MAKVVNRQVRQRFEQEIRDVEMALLQLDKARDAQQRAEGMQSAIFSFLRACELVSALQPKPDCDSTLNALEAAIRSLSRDESVIDPLNAMFRSSLNRYESLLAALNASTFEEHLLMLTERDYIHDHCSALSRGFVAATSSLPLDEISAADSCLLHNIAQSQADFSWLATYRSRQAPPPSRWWWYLDRHLSHEDVKLMGGTLRA